MNRAYSDKRYYSIGEVAELFDVSKSLIRYWESEFDNIKPHKNSKGDRRFTQENIGQIEVIYQLVKVRGFTLEGAKREMQQQKNKKRQRHEVVDRLKALKSFLIEIRDHLED